MAIKHKYLFDLKTTQKSKYPEMGVVYDLYKYIQDVSTEQFADTDTDLTFGGHITADIVEAQSQMITPAVFSDATIGTVGTGVRAYHYSNGSDYTTVLNFSGITLASPSGAGNKAFGYKIYTFPAGYHVHTATYMNVTLDGSTSTLQADTPDLGIGSVVASGSVAVLGGTATFEDYITGQTAADCDGTATVTMTAATAGALTGISMNLAGSTKAVYLNVADGQGGAGTVTASGSVVLKQTRMNYPA